ncbi:cation:proton antiporter [Dokdonella sp.]|uniref:cation:proton antiporter n=1 Tax=Dokdonella sp. TaxID=2291710 RepID=UPI0035277A85
MNPMSMLFLQLVVILGVARLLGLLLGRIGQPPVIGEMLAGILLGPMLLGAIAPAAQAWLFAPESLAPLEGLSQIGLVLFMFIVGAELRLPDGARRHLTVAGLTGLLSVLLPFALGLAISPMLHGRFAPAGVAFWPFALFMAASMAITAFPIMARILKERGMTESAVGRLSLTSAALADVLAWIVLAFVVAMISSRGGWAGFAVTVLGTLGMAVFAFAVLRPLLARALTRHGVDGQPSTGLLALLLIGAFACAAITDALGLHAVFGAFVFGSALPRDNRLLACLVERIEHVAVLVLMPVFFALAGLHTTPDALGGAGGVALALILAAAVLGKVLGGAAGAKAAGFGWREAFAVGSLMNARALMELIVMKVGLDIGVIGAEIFTMLMIMAIVTTLMTTPLLSLFTRTKTVQLTPANGAATLRNTP